MQVLIIDSSILVIQRLGKIISEAKNVTAIRSAVSYEEAKKLLKGNKYDTVLLDIDLPGNESLKLLKEIKKADEKTFVIILSTPIDNYLEEECKSFGADFFFDKYNDFKKIREVIDSIRRPAEKPASTSAEIFTTVIVNGKLNQQELTTDIFKNIGLCETILNVARDTMEVNPVKIFLELADFREHIVSNKFKLNVFRIVQEQLNNILKHAKATEVTISLLQIKKSIVLSISDNGDDFDTSQKQTGIINIKNEATSYNEIADFISQPGRGCILTVTFPVTGEI
ncbi:MAG TPA: response regulator [Chitinophagaceae bacterium]|nr:response regulator [Chitinophagaceae bacterium]